MKAILLTTEKKYTLGMYIKKINVLMSPNILCSQFSVDCNVMPQMSGLHSFTVSRGPGFEFGQEATHAV